MKKLLIIFAFLVSGTFYAQTTYEFEKIEEAPAQIESKTYEKDRDYAKERSFSEDLNNKYSSDSDFNYVENKEQVEEKRESSTTTSRGGGAGFSFLGNVLPWILVIILVGVVVVAILRGTGMSTIGMKHYKTPEAEMLLSEEEDPIDEGDFERLLARAIKNGNFRLATRYYYLWSLKQLSQKKYIEYHKDKTNTEYLFELKDQTMRSGFSYLSYVYSYIWYGEFPVDEVKFATIAEKYKSFINQIK